MKITKISVEWTRTVNMGNYHSIRPGVILEAELEEGEDVGDVTKELMSQAKTLCAIEALDMADETETLKRVGVKDYVHRLFESD